MMMMTMLTYALAQAMTPGGWQIEETISKLDGTSEWTATVAAQDTVFDILDEPGRPSLTVGCPRGKLAVMVEWPDFVDPEPGERSVLVRWSVDGGKVNTTLMYAGTRSVLADSEDAKTMLDALAAGRSLVVAVPDRHGDQEATFDVAGAAAVRDHAATCR